MVLDIESGKVVPPALLDGVNADLAAHQRQTTTPGG
jgi:hypothetical protein